MTITDIPYEFIRQRTDLGWNELKFGLDQQLIKPNAAIDRATEQLWAAEAAPKEVLELASSTKSESVVDLVSCLARNEAPTSDEQVKAKWLYLVLAWLFENRASLADALGMVESVYSDFDYPPEIVPFVRYMPIDGPDLGNREGNEERMLDRWKTYLDRARDRFGRAPCTGSAGTSV